MVGPLHLLLQHYTPSHRYVARTGGASSDPRDGQPGLQLSRSPRGETRRVLSGSVAGPVRDRSRERSLHSFAYGSTICSNRNSISSNNSNKVRQSQKQHKQPCCLCGFEVEAGQCGLGDVLVQVVVSFFWCAPYAFSPSECLYEETMNTDRSMAARGEIQERIELYPRRCGDARR